METRVNSSSIKPMIDYNENQIILQRHCAYKDGSLKPSSVDDQIDVVTSFIDGLDKDDLNNTYFLFTASNTTSEPDFKRCVETTTIAMEMIRRYLISNNIDESNIINLNDNHSFKGKIKETDKLTEPGMFTDNTGFFEYLKEKYGDLELPFWIAFETDSEKDMREKLGSEGPDEIVERGVKYIEILNRYSDYFYNAHPNSKLFIWAGTHYDLISPLVKQTILNYTKEDDVFVDNCGGISIITDEEKNTIASVNGITYPYSPQYKKQLRPHF